MLKSKSSLLNNKGNAIIEIIPVLAIFILLINFALGFFGLIHSGILNSIAARNYAFETFRNRADLRYLRDVPGSATEFTYAKSGVRFHVVRNEVTNSEDKFVATRRPIRFSDINGVSNELGSAEHDTKVIAIAEGARASDKGIEEGVNPAWVRTAYGICLNAVCGSN